jgi:hypothetical protein
VIERVGPFDEQFEGAFFEDDDYLERLRAAGIPTVQVASVRVESSRIGLTMSKIPERAEAWYAANERRFAESRAGRRRLPTPALHNRDRRERAVNAHRLLERDVVEAGRDCCQEHESARR